MAERAANALVSFTLRAIYVRESHVRLHEDFDPLMQGQPLNGKFRVRDGTVDCRELRHDGPDETVIRSCSFTNRFEFIYTRPGGAEGIVNRDAQPPGGEISPLVEITAAITTDYLVNTPNFPSDDVLTKFGASNAVLHSWPYWREFCHSAMLRSGIPVTMIPLLNLDPAGSPE